METEEKCFLCHRKATIMYSYLEGDEVIHDWLCNICYSKQRAATVTNKK
jgi:hypothetical protein